MPKPDPPKNDPPVRVVPDVDAVPGDVFAGMGGVGGPVAAPPGRAPATPAAQLGDILAILQSLAVRVDTLGRLLVGIDAGVNALVKASDHPRPASALVDSAVIPELRKMQDAGWQVSLTPPVPKA
jgi:hypothetical protein